MTDGGKKNEEFQDGYFDGLNARPMQIVSESYDAGWLAGDDIRKKKATMTTQSKAPEDRVAQVLGLLKAKSGIGEPSDHFAMNLAAAELTASQSRERALEEERDKAIRARGRFFDIAFNNQERADALTSENKALKEKLRLHVIAETHLLAEGGTTVHAGYRCKACGGDWKIGRPECHKHDCLAALQQSQEKSS